jgi:hypothetical protein
VDAHFGVVAQVLFAGSSEAWGQFVRASELFSSGLTCGSCAISDQPGNNLHRKHRVAGWKKQKAEGNAGYSFGLQTHGTQIANPSPYF